MTKEKEMQAYKASAFVAYKNTDVEIYRKPTPPDFGGDFDGYYQPSLHITKEGALAIKVGGTVYTKTIEAWHELAGGRHKSIPAEKAEMTAGEAINKIQKFCTEFSIMQWEGEAEFNKGYANGMINMACKTCQFAQSLLSTPQPVKPEDK